MPNNEQKIEVRRAALRPELVKRSDKLPLIRGYAAVYFNENDPGTEYRLWSDVVERIRPGAFDRAVREDDVRGLFNHDEDKLLGRTKSGTMRLSTDARGLLYEMDPPDTQAARDAVTVIDRGDVDGSSFMFIPMKVTWEEHRKADGSMLTVRWIDEVMLYDVGPVTFPAYQATEAKVRTGGGDESIRAEHDEWAKGRSVTPDPQADADLIAVTLNQFDLLEAVT